jgi:hypothetical protein
MCRPITRKCKRQNVIKYKQGKKIIKRKDVKVRDKERCNEVDLPTKQTYAELYGQFLQNLYAYAELQRTHMENVYAPATGRKVNQ